MKVVCTFCQWRGDSDDLLSAVHPFDSDDTIEGCPVCRDVGFLKPACDEPDCWALQTCGTPTPDGYRQTCGAHRPKEQPLHGSTSEPTRKTDEEIRGRMAKWEAELKRERAEPRPDREIKNLCYARIEELLWVLGE